MKQAWLLSIPVILLLGGCETATTRSQQRTPAAITAAVAQQAAAPRAWLGIQMMDADPLLKESLGLADRSGILVVGTMRGSPAMLAGISAGDFITRVNGMEIKDTQQLRVMVGSSAPDTVLRVEVVRNSRSGIMPVVLGNPPPPGAQQAVTWPGFTVGILNEESRQAIGLTAEARGVLVSSVEPFWENLRQRGQKVPQRGDLILEVDGRAVSGPYEFYKAINSSLQERIRVRFARVGQEGFEGAYPNPFLNRNKVVNLWAEPPLRSAARPSAAGSQAGAARKDLPLLSVLDFKTDELAKSQMWIIVDVLSGALVDTRRFRVLERGQRDKLLKEVESSTSEAFDEAHQLKIGRLIAADNIVIGSLAKVEGSYILSLKLVEVETGETRSAAFKSFPNVNAVVEGCPELARKLGEY